MSTQRYSFPAGVSAAILAGGKNERIGGVNKSFIEVNGIPIIRRTINVLKEIFKEIIIVTNLPQDYEGYKKDCSIVRDRIKGIGPIGGIFTALGRTTGDAVFFVACDMPFLHNELILRQLAYFKDKGCDALVPRIGGFIEPLHAVYKKKLKRNMMRFIKDNNGYSVRSFLDTVNTCYWDLDDKSFYRNIFQNLNTRDDVDKVKGILCR